MCGGAFRGVCFNHRPRAPQPLALHQTSPPRQKRADISSSCRCRVLMMDQGGLRKITKCIQRLVKPYQLRYRLYLLLLSSQKSRGTGFSYMASIDFEKGMMQDIVVLPPTAVFSSCSCCVVCPVCQDHAASIFQNRYRTKARQVRFGSLSLPLRW